MGTKEYNCTTLMKANLAVSRFKMQLPFDPVIWLWYFFPQVPLNAYKGRFFIRSLFVIEKIGNNSNIH